jgi:hypothetical protein
LPETSIQRSAAESTTQRTSYIFDRLIAHVLECTVDPAPYILMYNTRNYDPTRFGQRLQPGRYIDPIAKNIAILDDDVADVDSHPELDAPVLRHSLIAGSHLPLCLHRASNSVDHAGELSQEAVTSSLDYAATMLGDLRVADLSAQSAQHSERGFLVLTHKPGIACYIDRQYRCKATLDALSAHLSLSSDARRTQDIQ